MTTAATPRGIEEGTAPASGRESLLVYAGVGIYLGFLFIRSEVASWYRIQEMFRFQSIHMYGIIGLAVAAGALGILILKRAGARTVRGDSIGFPGAEDARPRIHHALGGICFGLGWGLVGACPGPLFALVGAAVPAMVLGLLSAVAGAWTYGWLRAKLPHG